MGLHVANVLAIIGPCKSFLTIFQTTYSEGNPMPRIPEPEIERIKRHTDLAALIRARGVELRPHGSKDLAGKCPFHEDDQPSFIVSPEKGLYHCMGCGAAGNAIQFVQKFDGVSFRHAFELLDAGTAAFSPPHTAPVKKAIAPRLESPLDATADDAEIMRQVVDYYHERLLKTPAALDYLRNRGLHHEAAFKQFRIGFSDRTLGLHLPNMQRKDGEEIRTRLQALGIYRPNGREHLNGCIVVPIFSASALTEMYGRRIQTPQHGAPKHLFLPGPHAGIWNAEALDAPDLILCEAPFDALTFWVNGFHNVTFIYGTEGFTDELFQALLARKVRRIRIAYDADEAGNRAAIRDAERLTAHGIDCFRIKFPWCKDANEYAQRQATGTLRKSMPAQPPAVALQTLLNAADWMSGRIHRQPEASTHTPTPAPSSLINLAANLAADAKVAASSASSPIRVDPCASVVQPPLTRSGDYHLLNLGPREYRIGGLDKNNSLEVLKVAVRLRHGEEFHLDSFDMAQDNQRRRFIERAAEETRLEKELIKRDVGRLLLALETALQERIASALSPEPRTQPPELSPAERAEALAFLQSPELVEKIGHAFDACGLVGEDANRLAAYLACTSRKLDKPLAVIIQSTSAAGKSTLMEAVLAMFPEEERIKYSAMTGQSLYYLGETNLKHKILAIVEEEGAEKASYALKLLQSEGELTIASTGKDPQTGRMETQEYHVEGPVMIFLTTTAVEIDEELLNRCLILTVDESREQTARIHTLQRKARTLEGLVAREEKKDLLRVLRNAQRLLQPLAVVNPYADELTFTADRTRTRRDHEKYLTLIDTIALLHQHQRTPGTQTVNGRPVPFIRATLDDIALANRLAPELLGRSLDELPPQTRRVFETIKAIVRARCEAEQIDPRAAFFSRREVRARLGWGITQIRAHLERLRDLEYIEARFGRTGSAFQYELLTDASESADPAHIGLIDVEKLNKSTPTTPTCRDNKPPVGGCRNAPRQVQPLAETHLRPNLSACCERTSGTLAAAVA